MTYLPPLGSLCLCVFHHSFSLSVFFCTACASLVWTNSFFKLKCFQHDQIHWSNAFWLFTEFSDTNCRFMIAAFWWNPSRIDIHIILSKYLLTPTSIDRRSFSICYELKAYVKFTFCFQFPINRFLIHYSHRWDFQSVRNRSISTFSNETWWFSITNCNWMNR